MPDARRRAWFAPKHYGYGAGLPITWQGWVSLLLFLVVTPLPWFVVAMPLAYEHYLVEAGIFGVLTDAVALVAFLQVRRSRTAGGWRWTWGNRE